MVKFSRFVLIFVVIFVLSIIIPKYYWLAFEKRVSLPNVIFSSLKKDFIYSKKINGKIYRYDNNGRNINKKQFQELAPLYFYRSLLYSDKMPAKIDTYKVNIQNLKLNTIFTQIKPENISSPQIMLFPLLESMPEGPKLEMPNDFFRINNKMEFINCKSNSIIPKLTTVFTNKLKDKGFVFPAVKIFGNPTTMKPFDEGYFVIDTEGQLFHIKRIHNKPYVKRIDLPNDLKPVYINVTEMNLREFYGLLISSESEVFLISYDNYKLIKIPIENYDFHKMRLLMQGNPLYRTFTIKSDTSLTLIVTDRNYDFVKKYYYKWQSKYDTFAGKFISFFFPFTLKLNVSYSDFIDFYFRFSGWISVLGILASLIFYFIIQKRKGPNASQCKFDYFVILITGFYGLIALLLIRDESWKI